MLGSFRRRRRACAGIALALAASLAAVAGGCKSSKPTAAPAAEADELPPNRLAALKAGDRLISEGEDLKEQGLKLKREGKDQEGDALVTLGEQKMIEGEKAKRDAMMMAN